MNVSSVIADSTIMTGLVITYNIIMIGIIDGLIDSINS